MPADEEASKAIAVQLEQDHPHWIVVFGVYTKEFVAFPRFRAPQHIILAAFSPKALSGQMTSTEHRLRAAEQQAV
jgi:hypothetical protein